MRELKNKYSLREEDGAHIIGVYEQDTNKNVLM